MSNVLIADDEDAIRNFLVETLRETHTVFEAANGKEALAIMRLGQIDVLVLDLMLPEMDGFELMVHLQEEKLSAPVILISGDETIVTPGFSRIPYALGAVQVLGKPFHLQELKDAIHVALNGSAPGN